jgi:hypothetical protein
MEKYLKSTAVKVYPSAFRGLATGTKYNPEARLNTEFNVTNLTNRLASKDNFVIAWNSGAKIITFNIHGYYFETDLTEFLDVLDKEYSKKKPLNLIIHNFEEKKIIFNFMG